MGQIKNNNIGNDYREKINRGMVTTKMINMEGVLFGKKGWGWYEPLKIIVWDVGIKVLTLYDCL